MEEAKKIQIMSILAEIWEREHGQQLDSLTISRGGSKVIINCGGIENGKMDHNRSEPDHLVAGIAAGA